MLRAEADAGPVSRPATPGLAAPATAAPVTAEPVTAAPLAARERTPACRGA